MTKKSLVEQVEVEIEAVLGSSHMTVADLTALKANDLIELDHLIHEPVKLRLNGQTFACGEIVTVDDMFAIRIKEIEA